MLHSQRQRNRYCSGPAFPGGREAYEYVPARCVRHRASIPKSQATKTQATQDQATKDQMTTLHSTLVAEYAALESFADAMEPLLNGDRNAPGYDAISRLTTACLESFSRHVVATCSQNSQNSQNSQSSKSSKKKNIGTFAPKLAKMLRAEKSIVLRHLVTTALMEYVVNMMTVLKGLKGLSRERGTLDDAK